MDSTEGKDGADHPVTPSISDPTVTFQSPSIEEALARAEKKFIDEDFVQAALIIDHLLQTHPDLESAKKLRQQIQSTASNLAHEILNQGINCYMDCDWDRATAFWEKCLRIVPNDTNVLEWIQKAGRKKEWEKRTRAELLHGLEECGKMLSERNYVVAEEQLEELKDKFTGAFRLADLQRIYEALVVRTRVELEKEFEDLRSNIVEPVKAARLENQISPAEQKPRNDPLQQQYMEAFETGKKHFEKGEWQKALGMWRTAASLNPNDVNLTHWMALAENNLSHYPIQHKQSPVRATIAFLSVFVVTASVAYFAYIKYIEREKETKNRNLIQRSIEHYRAGRLEESWKTLQIYVLQDPENDSARTLLERVTAEMNAREKIESTLTKIQLRLSEAREHAKSQNYAAAIESYRGVLELEPNHPQAGREYEQLLNLLNSSQTTKTVASLLHEAAVLLARGDVESAEVKLKQAQNLDPENETVQTLLARITTQRDLFKKLSIQLETAKYLYARNQKEGAVLVLNRILSEDPGHSQAKQLLSKIRAAAAVSMQQRD